MSERAWILTALERHEAALVLYARRITGDLERARDVVQETFLELCSADRAAVEPRLRQWLYTVCRNRALDLRRKERGLASLTDGMENGSASTTADPAEIAEERESGTRLLALLGRLPAKQREALRLRFQGGLSYREIAEATGWTTGNVGWLIHTGLRSLGEKLSTGALEGRGV